MPRLGVLIFENRIVDCRYRSIQIVVIAGRESGAPLDGAARCSRATPPARSRRQSPMAATNIAGQRTTTCPLEGRLPANVVAAGPARYGAEDDQARR